MNTILAVADDSLPRFRRHAWFYFVLWQENDRPDFLRQTAWFERVGLVFNSRNSHRIRFEWIELRLTKQVVNILQLQTDLSIGRMLHDIFPRFCLHTLVYVNRRKNFAGRLTCC